MKNSELATQTTREIVSEIAEKIYLDDNDRRKIFDLINIKISNFGIDLLTNKENIKDNN